MITQATTDNFNEHISSGIVVVDFFAVWCGPCKMIAPYLEDLAKKLEGRVSFVSLDVDEEPTIAGEQGITAMPTLKLFNNGKVIQTIVGADLQSLVTAIQKELEKEEATSKE